MHRHGEVVGAKTRLAETQLAVRVIQAQRILGVDQVGVAQQHGAGQRELFGVLDRHVQMKIDLALAADIDAEQLHAETLADRRCLEQSQQVAPRALRVGVEFEQRLAEIDHVGGCVVELVALHLAGVHVDAQRRVDEIGGRMHVFGYRPVRQILQRQIVDLGTRLESAPRVRNGQSARSP